MTYMGGDKSSVIRAMAIIGISAGLAGCLSSADVTAQSAPSLQGDRIYMTKTGRISFFSHASMEDIEAVNDQATGILNAETGEIGFVVLVRGFKFAKALMQEHFNENYMESDKFPKAKFTGKITGFQAAGLKEGSIYKVMVEGDLTIHGVTRKARTEGTLELKGGKIHAQCKFPVKLSEYNVKIPAQKINNIAPVVDVTVGATYEPAPKGK